MAGRSTPSQAMEEAPPQIPVLSSAGISHMVVTRPGTAAGGGGEGPPRRGMGERGQSFPFNTQLTGFSEGGAGGAGAAVGGASGRLERSLPSGLTDPTEVKVVIL